MVQCSFIVVDEISNYKELILLFQIDDYIILHLRGDMGLKSFFSFK